MRSSNIYTNTLLSACLCPKMATAENRSQVVAGHIVEPKPLPSCDCANVNPNPVSGIVGGGFSSPLEAMKSAPEDILYIPAVLNRSFDGSEHPDYLATVDVNPKSPTFSQVVHRLQMPVVGDELHHMGWNACSSCHGKPGVVTHNYLIAPGVLSGNVYFIDVKTNPRAPHIHKTITADELADKCGVALPHTAHCAPTEIIMSFMGGPKSEGFPGGGNGYVSIDPKTLEINGRWERGESKQSFGYDFWYKPRHNVMISSEWGEPTCFASGFNPEHVAAGQYGRKLYVWDFEKHIITQELDCGEGAIPLEVRFCHEPTSKEGFVGCALSSEMVRFYQVDGGKWAVETVTKIPAIPVEGWALPEMPALITDFCLSLDDRFFYVACWLHGDVRQYDISDTRNPRLVGQAFIGGSMQKGSGVIRTDGGEQPDPLIVKGVHIQGGAQMLQLSLDGKRLYISTSLFSAWDSQFYPEMAKKGGQLLLVDVDSEKGGLTVNKDFLVDFGAEPFGAALCHEMRFPGGDSTSDIWM